MSVDTLEPVVREKLRELRLYAHSGLLYWWPVWAVAFVVAACTALDNHHMVLVPNGAEVTATQVAAPEGKPIVSPLVHVSRSRVPGLVFVLTLLFVVVCMAATAAAVLLLISWFEWWDPLFRWFGLLQVYVNLGGYLLVAVPLLIAWVVTVFFLDRRTYMVLSVGQVRFCDHLGEEERAFDTSHVVFEKRPYDWFRRLVGFGAGDMIIRTGGAQPQTMELRNVVRVGKWMSVIEERLRTKDVV
jgi:hypothetical protein